MGFRTVDVDCKLAGRSLVRIFIERQLTEPGLQEKTGVSLDDCAEASRLIGPLLETEECLPGAFDLEVSSPGLDRRLRLRSDFEQFVGQEVKLKLAESIPGMGANPACSLTGVEKEFILVSSQGKEVSVPFSKIKRANLIWKVKI